MEKVWLRADLGLEIMKGDQIYGLIDQTIKDMTANVIDIATLVQNMSSVLTHKDPEERVKGMKYFTHILKTIPKDFLNATQLQFISTFYTDRLKDNHRVIPAVVEGYLTIVDMKNYQTVLSQHFFSALFKHVACQSQVKEDRRNIYLIVKKILDKDPDCLKAMGPDFLYGFITSMDGERCPVNLVLLFSLLPTLVRQVPLGHLADELFDVMSCYFPVDFTAPRGAGEGGEVGVTRAQLAAGLAPCLCAAPDFAPQCLPLLLEKLDSPLKTAKTDALKLLAESCRTFPYQAYYPFLKALSAALLRAAAHAGDADAELPAAALRALYALVASLARAAHTDDAFEDFVRSLLINCQCAISEARTVAHFEPRTHTLLTVANAAKDACRIVSDVMISAMISYYDLCFQDNAKLQLGCLDFLATLYIIAKRWDILAELGDLSGIPRLLLTAASNTSKQYQMAAFKNLIKTVSLLNDELSVPFIEILMHNIDSSNDAQLVDRSVECICSIGKEHPAYVTDIILEDKIDLDNLTDDKPLLKKRLKLLSKLAGIDDFTDPIIEELVDIMVNGESDDALDVITALDAAVTDGSYTEEKIIYIEVEYELVSNVTEWASKAIANSFPVDKLLSGLNLMSDTISKLDYDTQLEIIQTQSVAIQESVKCGTSFLMVLDAMHRSLLPKVFAYHFTPLLLYALEVLFLTQNPNVKESSCSIIAHMLNKMPMIMFEAMHNALTNKMAGVMERPLTETLILLCGYMAKGMVLRGREEFVVFFDKVVEAVLDEKWGERGAAAVRVMAEPLAGAHCIEAPLHRQRVWVRWLQLASSRLDTRHGAPTPPSAWLLLAWAHLLHTLPRSLLFADDEKVVRVTGVLVSSALMAEQSGTGVAVWARAVGVGARVLRELCAGGSAAAARHLNLTLPSLCRLAACPALMPMDVRILALECVVAAAQTYRTSALLGLRRDVLALLQPALDDRKRLVRSAARAARLRWALVGAPGEDKDD